MERYVPFQTSVKKRRQVKRNGKIKENKEKEKWTKKDHVLYTQKCKGVTRRKKLYTCVTFLFFFFYVDILFDIYDTSKEEEKYGTDIFWFMKINKLMCFLICIQTHYKIQFTFKIRIKHVLGFPLINVGFLTK